jgi:hypothetical protein
MKRELFFIRILLLTLVTGYVLSSCASRPSCQTAEGKKKLKYYNSIQYK